MSDIPDGANTMPNVTRPRPIDRTGRKDPNIAKDYSETTVEDGQSPMADNLRKGSFGSPISGKGPTTQPNDESFVPDASTEGAVEKFGLGKGKYGAI